MHVHHIWHSKELLTLVAIDDEGEQQGYLEVRFGEQHLSPQISVITARNKRATNLLRDTAAEVIYSLGYTVAYGINQTGRKNKVWKRAFTPKGWKSTKTMAVNKFEKVD